MIRIRQSDDRHHTNRGWLDSYFTFSFAEYDDPSYRGYHGLRVMNEDTIAPGGGFGPHAHRDMEILTYVLEGGLLHRDSMGEEHVVGPNEVQTMSAGSGIVHSEFNASGTQPVHLLQIWIDPDTEDLVPSYQQIAFEESEKRGRFRMLAGPEADVEPGATVIRQDARLYVAALTDETLTAPLAAGRHAYVQVARGSVTLNGERLETGDGAAIHDEATLAFATNGTGGEFLLFDLP